jgi:signal transduction histidine kinase
VPDHDAALPARLETAAYFTLAEGLSNAVKHAQARKLWVSLARDDTWLTIEVRDDGVGGAHLDGGGLRGIADRVEALGGHLHLDSRRGRGTRLRVELPCES